MGAVETTNDFAVLFSHASLMLANGDNEHNQWSLVVGLMWLHSIDVWLMRCAAEHTECDGMGNLKWTYSDSNSYSYKTLFWHLVGQKLVNEEVRNKGV